MYPPISAENFQKLHFNPFVTQNDKKVCYTPPMRKYIVWTPVQYGTERGTQMDKNQYADKPNLYRVVLELSKINRPEKVLQTLELIFKGSVNDPANSD
jgi:hypothetical protein